MKKLSYWASRHVRIAIFLIILCEVANGFNGVLLGASLLDNVPLRWLSGSMVVLIGTAIAIRHRSTHSPVSTNYWIGRRYLFAAFSTNFFLFMLLGGIWGQRLQTGHPSVSVLGSRRIDAVRDTLPPADSLRSARRLTSAPTELTKPRQGGQRAQYILLGILGIFVAAIVAGLACHIACAGYGFLASLVFCLGLGSMAGSVYFFSRSAQQPIKRRRDMTVDERRRDSRRFWLPWVVLIGIFSVILLVSAGK